MRTRFIQQLTGMAVASCQTSSVRALELVVDNWLSAGLDAGDVITHWVKAGLGGVDLNDLFQLLLASLQLLFPSSAVGLAFFQHKWLRVLSLLEHRCDVCRG